MPPISNSRWFIPRFITDDTFTVEKVEVTRPQKRKPDTDRESQAKKRIKIDFETPGAITPRNSKDIPAPTYEALKKAFGFRETSEAPSIPEEDTPVQSPSPSVVTIPKTITFPGDIPRSKNCEMLQKMYPAITRSWIVAVFAVAVNQPGSLSMGARLLFTSPNWKTTKVKIVPGYTLAEIELYKSRYEQGVSDADAVMANE